MALSAGARLGAYEITAQIGMGGMGEVYRATDTKLKRQVAVKILMAAVADNPDRLARFQREAETLAALNHPNIAAIYGIEESGETKALVMELVEGPTLADRIALGSIPLYEALPIAKQIAEALEAAHAQGIIHRDLKPANIKLRPDDAVKVLDFGLAKTIEPAATLLSISQSPTIAPAAMTQAGVIFGTAAYMSPEQARGETVDQRADIWAFGCVLYEMLTGRMAFGATTAPETLAKVLEGHVDLTALPAATPPAVARLIRRCLQGSSRNRQQHMGDARADLVDALADERLLTYEPSHPVYGRAGRVSHLIFAGIAAVLGAATAAGLTWRAMISEPPRVVRSIIALPADQQPLVGPVGQDFVLTRAGTHLIYSTGEKLVVRPLDQLETTVIASSIDNLTCISASPDGQWIAYVEANNILKKVATIGGSTTRLLAMDGGGRGTAWATDDSVVFATSNLTTGLQRVSADGGGVTVLTRPRPERGELDHVWPETLPGGRGVLFTVLARDGGLEAARVAVLDTTAGTWTTVIAGHHARYASTGHLVYTEAGALRAVPFDLDKLQVQGAPVTILARVRTTVLGAGQFTVSDAGALAYVDAAPSGTSTNNTIVWLDREGHETPLSLAARPFQTPRLSPDESRIALSSRDQDVDLWSWDARRATLARETFDAGVDISPVWMPDSRRVIYASQRAGVRNLHMQTIGAGGTPVRLADSGNAQSPSSITRDGEMAVFDEQSPITRRDLWLMPLVPPGPAKPLLATRFEERNGVISPDGRWLAYESDSSGQLEVYVRPFPNVADTQWQVSTEGGRVPLWARNGRELYYVASNRTLMAISVAPGTAWNAGHPATVANNTYLYVTAPERSYDVAADGRFLTLKAGSGERGDAASQIVLVLNWFEELKRLAPTN